jgi:hypothetical protein
METPLATATRLIVALEELVMEETILVRTMDFSAAVEVRDRAAPLVEKLCELAGNPEVQSLRPRIGALLNRCDQNHQFIEEQRVKLQSELNRVTEARGRLRVFAPAYGSPYKAKSAAVDSRLNTAA